jgi:hypothetical protein
MTQTKAAFNQINGNVVSVLDYGAVGDGVTDDGSAVANTISAAATGSTIVFPSGSYLVGQDFGVSKKLHIIIKAGATITFTAQPSFSNGIGALNPGFQARYGAGIFNFLSGAEGSKFECYGVLNPTGNNNRTVSTEPVQVSGVMIRDCDNVKVFGDMEIQNTFNGVTVVDSDECKIYDVRVTNAPTNSNAAVDVEASDKGEIRRIRSTAGYEETVDLNTLNNDWVLDDIRGDNIDQNVLEINESINIRATNVKSINGECFHCFNYESSRERWTRRGRNVADYKNRGLKIDGTAWYDSSYSESLDNSSFDIEHSISGEYNLTVHVEDNVPGTERIGRYLHMRNRTDQRANRVRIQVYSPQVDLIDNAAGGTEDAGIVIERGIESYVSVWAWVAMTGASQPLIRSSASNTTVFIEMCRSQSGTGICFKSVASASLNNPVLLMNPLAISNFATKVTLNSDGEYVLPYTVGNDSERVVAGFGQMHISTEGAAADINEIDFYNRTAPAWVQTQAGYRSGSATPNGTILPRFIGEEYLDSTANVWYKSKATGLNDWVALN